MITITITIEERKDGTVAIGLKHPAAYCTTMEAGAADFIHDCLQRFVIPECAKSQGGSITYKGPQSGIPPVPPDPSRQ